MKILLNILCFIAFYSLSAQTYTGPQEDIDQILENITQFSKNVMAGDYEAIAKSYTADGKIFPNQLDIWEGQEALKKYWKPRNGNKTSYHKITPVEIKVTAEEAYDYGYYEGTTLREDRTESDWKGKYVIIWRKVGTEWKIYLDIWNSIKN